MAHTNEEQFLEPEEKQQSGNPVTVDTDMLTTEPVIDRSHASAGATGPTVAEFVAPEYQGEPPIDEQQPEQPQPSDHPLSNPAFNNADPDEIKDGAFVAAGLVIDSYEKIFQEVGNLVIPVSKRKLEKLQDKGEVDLDLPLPKRTGGHTTPRIEISAFNDNAQDAIQPNPEFKEKVQPMLAKELAKRNIGASNMQQILFYTGLDMYGKIAVMRQLYNQRADLIDSLREFTAATRAGGFQQPNYPSTPPSASPVVETPPAAPAQQQTVPPVQSQTFETTQTGNAFEDIQAARGGGTVIPMAAATPAHTPVRPRVHKKASKKRGPYKKKTREM